MSDIVVEFSEPSLSGNEEYITIIEVEHGEEYRVIGIEDLILSRLNEFVFWDRMRSDSAAALQLRLLIKGHRDTLRWDYLTSQAQLQDVDKGLVEILKLLDDEATY